MTAYNVQTPPHAGAAIAETAPATSGNTAPCGSGVGLLVKNGSGSSITVTVAVPAAITFDGLGIGDATPGSGGRVVTVAAGTDAIIPLVAADYMDPATGLATFAVSAVTTVLAAVISLAS